MVEYNEMPVTKIKKNCINITCNICNKQIPNGSKYYSVNTSHCDWGNDSMDSYNDFEICSNDCLNKKFNEYLEDKSVTKKISIEAEKADYKNM